MRVSILDINRYLEDKGYDIHPVKQSDGMYKCDIYKDDQYVRAAKNSYKTWQEAMRQTSIDMFNYFINVK